MTPADLLALYRDVMDDEAVPYLWSDTLILQYVSEAQQAFCRKTEGIEDSQTDSVTKLVLVPGTDWYDTSPLILKIRWIDFEDATAHQIPVVNPEKARNLGLRFDGKSGPAKVAVRGLTKNKLRFYPMPNVAATARMGVFRLPLTPVNGDTSEVALEIDEQHHFSLLMWMQYLGYSKQDSETFDKGKASDFEAQFEAYCKQALKEQERARREAGPVIYGGLAIDGYSNTRDYNNHWN